MGTPPPKVASKRSALMDDKIKDLQRRMEAAASALDFEEARRIRDRMNLMRGGANAEEAAQADTSGLIRQQPGTMGLARTGSGQFLLQDGNLLRSPIS